MSKKAVPPTTIFDTMLNDPLTSKRDVYPETVILSITTHGEIPLELKTITDNDGKITEINTPITYKIPDSIQEFYKFNAVAPGIINFVAGDNDVDVREVEKINSGLKRNYREYVSQFKEIIDGDEVSTMNLMIRDYMVRHSIEGKPIKKIAETLLPKIQKSISDRLTNQKISFEENIQELKELKKKSKHEHSKEIPKHSKEIPQDIEELAAMISDIENNSTNLKKKEKDDNAEKLKDLKALLNNLQGKEKIKELTEQINDIQNYIYSFSRGDQLVNCITQSRMMINKQYSLEKHNTSMNEDWSITCLNMPRTQGSLYTKIVERKKGASRGENRQTVNLSDIVTYLAERGVTRLFIVDLTCAPFSNETGYLEYNADGRRIRNNIIGTLTKMPYGGKRRRPKTKRRMNKTNKTRKNYHNKK